MDNINEGRLTATACFFSASKFYEVYPPSLDSFIYYHQDCLTRQAVIQKEADVMLNIDCRYDIALITDWFSLYSDAKMPNWAYSCYLYAPFIKSEDLALAIIGVVESTDTKHESSYYILKVLSQLKIKAPSFMKSCKIGKNSDKA